MANQELILKVSTPGKIILHGEHSVVYGKKAVALSLDLRTTLYVYSSSCLKLNFKDVNLQNEWVITELEELWFAVKGASGHDGCNFTFKINAVKSFLKIDECDNSPVSLTLVAFFYLYVSILHDPLPFSLVIESQIPPAAGLGSSASYAVSLSGAFLLLSQKINVNDVQSQDTATLTMINEWAMSCEKIFHGTPSGIDNTICSYGQCVSFKNGQIETLSGLSLKILLVNTQVPRNTKALVAQVKQRQTLFPDIINPILDAVDAIAEESINNIKSFAVSKCDAVKVNLCDRLCTLININHSLLCSLGVSHDKLDQIVFIAKRYGFPAKLTGAGGGGFGIIILFEGHKELDISACTKDLEAEGYEVWNTKIGVPGFNIHFYDSLY